MPPRWDQKAHFEAFWGHGKMASRCLQKARFEMFWAPVASWLPGGSSDASLAFVELTSLAFVEMAFGQLFF